MYYKPKTFISFLVLSTIAHHLNCGSLSAKENPETNGIYKDLYNLTDETRTSRGIRSGDLQRNASNPNSKRIERARSTLAFSDGHHNETLTKSLQNREYESSWRPDDSSVLSHNENGSLIRSVNKRAFNMDEGFQADTPGASGNVFGSQLGSKPMVRCSGDVMTLTAHGREYTHILVDRAGASPLYLFQLPSYCGYNVKVTWRDLVLLAPFDGCYITQENGSYVLPLLWWGRPIKIACPVTHISQPTPSVFCSYFGMIVGIEGAREPVEKHRVKVNGEVLLLLSETCAYRVNSPSDVVILHTPFSSKCVTLVDGENRLVIIVDGKQFTLSCPFPYHLSPYQPYLHSHSFHQPLQPKPLIPHVPASIRVSGTMHQPSTPSKPPLVPHVPYEPPLAPQPYPDRVQQLYTSVHDTRPIYQHQKPPPHTSSIFSQVDTGQQIQQVPDFHTSHGTTDEDQVPQQYHPMTPPLHYPILCPPYPEAFCSQYPQYHQTWSAASKPPVQPMPEISVSRLPAYMPPTPPLTQTALLPQLPIFPPLPTEQPPEITSPSLSCARNRITATLPSAKMDTVKVKDTKTNKWISIASVLASCNYTLRSRGGAVVLLSPLPACHTQKQSSSVISLFIRFWDSSQLRTRTIQLQCRHVVSPDTLKPLHLIIPGTATAPARQPPKVQVLCSSQHMSVKVPPGPTSGLVVEAPSSGIKTQTKAVPLLEAPSHCGYSVKRAKDRGLNILLPYFSCHMTRQDGQHKIILKYQTADGRTIETLLSCQASDSQECNVVTDQQLVCGSGALSSTECLDKGCCYNLDAQMCYYPMDECTADRHFVFSVHTSVANPPLSPSTLVTAGNGSCSPDKVTEDFALFKIPLDECGVHRYEVGKTVIYMVEILNRVQSVSLNYGTITRDSPVRLLVECRYYPGSVVSVGYLVKSPSLGPSIKAQGVFGVQLRIAKDEHYNDFYPQYHQPLRMLLGKPLYLEVRLLNPPDPTAMLLVHYCVAYPRLAKSAWILIYDGCPNSLDQTPTHKPPATPAEALTNHVRRFTVTTFQFLPEDDNLQTDEEIYFMCSTEVCLPSDGPCIEGCFGDPANVKS